ncbi:MAG: carboxymuconolactone decarboxylase family protein [Actinobacteria bacterium]|nr:carboxymuconolactone decarboxylase family protein [Actinomycetota bacterium]
MTRSPNPAEGALSPQTREMLAALPQNNVFRALAHADAAFPPLMELTASLWNDAVLGQRQRELAILRTARLVDSAYEWMHHIEVARMVGVTEEELNAIDVGRLDLVPFADADRLLLEAVPHILNHCRSEDHVFDALREHFSLRELVELHLVVGLYATIAGVVTDFDVELEPRSGAFELQHDERGPRLGG